MVSEAATTTIRDMAYMVSEKISGGKSKVVFDIPKNMMQFGYAADVQLRLSSEKLEQLGWMPQVAPELDCMYRRLVSSFESKKYCKIRRAFYNNSLG